MLDNLDISDSMSDEPETISSGGTSSGYGSNTGKQYFFVALKIYNYHLPYKGFKIAYLSDFGLMFKNVCLPIQNKDVLSFWDFFCPCEPQGKQGD